MRRMSLHSHRDFWDYIRIDHDAVELSRAQAEVLSRLPDDTKLMLFSQYAGGIKYLLPEHRRLILSSIGRVETAEQIPLRGSSPSQMFPAIDGVHCSSLSDDEATWVVLETLQVVEEEGRKLRRQLQDGVDRGDRDKLLRVLSDNIWCRWFLSHVIAPFLDDYAIVLDQIGIDPEQIRAQSMSLQQARGQAYSPGEHTTTPAAEPSSDLSQPAQVPIAGHEHPQKPPTRAGAAALPLGLGTSVSSGQPPDPGAAAAPARRMHPLAQGQSAAQPTAVSPQESSAALAVPTSDSAAGPAMADGLPAAPLAPSLPAGRSSQPPRTYTATVLVGGWQWPPEGIEETVDRAPPPKEQATQNLVNGYTSLLGISDTIERLLRSEVPEADWHPANALHNTTHLPVLRHPFGKTYAAIIAKRIATAMELLSRADASDHITPDLQALSDRFEADTGHPLPVRPGSVNGTITQPAAPPAPPQAVASPALPPAQSPTTAQPAPGVEPLPGTPAAAAVSQTVSGPRPSPGDPAASLPHPLAGAGHPHGPASAYPLPQSGPQGMGAHPPPAAAPAVNNPAAENRAAPAQPAPVPFPAAPGLPPLTADPLALFAPARPVPHQQARKPDRQPTAAPDGRSPRASLASAVALLCAPCAVAYDGLVHWRKTRRMAAQARRSARRRPVPPPATRPRSTAARSVWHAMMFVLVVVGCVAGAIVGVQVYRAPPAWLFAAQGPAPTRYVVAAQPVLVPVFPTAEAARMPKVEPGVTPVIRPDISYPVLSSQGDVLQIAIITQAGKSAGWVSAPLMREVLPPQ